MTSEISLELLIVSIPLTKVCWYTWVLCLCVGGVYEGWVAVEEEAWTWMWEREEQIRNIYKLDQDAKPGRWLVDTNDFCQTFLFTFCKLQSCSKTAFGPPFLNSWIEIDATVLASMRPLVFSSTHYNTDEEKLKLKWNLNFFGIIDDLSCVSRK